MPANVSYEYVNAKNKYDQAKTNEEKIIALQEMLSTAPTHKGAENLRKDLSRKLSSLKSKLEKQEAMAKKSGSTISVKKEGAGQVSIVGLPNSGKSTFLKKITNAKPDIANYPFTTTLPEKGILNYGGALIQLVELPSFLDQSQEISAQIFSILRVTDSIIFIIRDGDTSQIDSLINKLEKQDIYVIKKKPKIDVKKNDFSGLTLINDKNLVCDKKQAIDLLKDSGFRSKIITFNQKTDIKDLLLLINPRASYINTMVVSIPFTKNIKPFKYKSLDVFDFSDIKNIRNNIFKILNKNIIFTKKPGEKADFTEPLVVDKNTTVKVAAKAIHKKMYNDLRSARVWGSAKFDGQKVSKNYILQNGDIVEFVL